MSTILNPAPTSVFQGVKPDQIQVTPVDDVSARTNQPDTSGIDEPDEGNAIENNSLNSERDKSGPDDGIRDSGNEKPQSGQSEGATPDKPQISEIPIDEIVDKVDRKALLQAMGYDEFAINAMDYYREKGNFEEYVTVKSLNFDEMTPEQIMRFDYAKRYKGLDEATLDYKIRKDLHDKYGITDDLDEEQAKAPRSLLSFEMESVRKQLKEEQAKFHAPARESVQYDPEKQKEQLLQEKAIADFVGSKTLSLGQGEDGFKYTVKDPSSLLPVIYDGEALSQALSVKDAKGNPTDKVDFNLALEVAAFLADPVGFKKAILNHGKSIGKIAIQDKLENLTTDVDKGTPPRQERNVFEAMARRGRHI